MNNFDQRPAAFFTVLLLLFIVQLTSASYTKGCPVRKFITLSPTLLHRPVNERLTWQGARDYCKSICSDLVVDGMKDKRIARTLSYEFTDFISSAWVGLRKVNETWTWLDGTTNVTSGWDVNWQPYEYEDSNTCGYTWYDTRLYDGDCDWLKYAICEAKIVDQCLMPAGVESFRIEDEYLISSSDVNQNYSAKYGRLNQPDHCWSPKVRRPGEWLMVDLTVTHNVTGIVLQGCNVDDTASWIPSYKLIFSLDRKTWFDEQFNGASSSSIENHEIKSSIFNADIAMVRFLNNSIRARYVKVVILSWKFNPGLRMEVLGCPIDDVCSNNPCMNKGKCLLQQDGDYTCACTPSYTGRNCDEIAGSETHEATTALLWSVVVSFFLIVLIVLLSVKAADSIFQRRRMNADSSSSKKQYSISITSCNELCRDDSFFTKYKEGVITSKKGSDYEKERIIHSHRSIQKDSTENMQVQNESESLICCKNALYENQKKKQEERDISSSFKTNGDDIKTTYDHHNSRAELQQLHNAIESII